MEPSSERLLVMGLVVGCPHESNPTECTLNDVRTKPVSERVEWARKLADEQVKQILRIHRDCSADREKRSKLNKSK